MTVKENGSIVFDFDYGEASLGSSHDSYRRGAQGYRNGDWTDKIDALYVGARAVAEKEAQESRRRHEEFMASRLSKQPESRSGFHLFH